jgi:serine/threonine protein kinase
VNGADRIAWPPSAHPCSGEKRKHWLIFMTRTSLSMISRGSPAWLPSVDRRYFEGTIERGFFRPAWNSALRNPQFVDRFRAFIEPVESAVDTIVEDMTELNSDIATRTLVHTDLNPSNVLVFNDMPYIIDWGTAHVGSFYPDLPHHLSTLDQAEVYRIAMEQRGYALDPTAFARSYAIAARYTGLRYLW